MALVAMCCIVLRVVQCVVVCCLLCCPVCAFVAFCFFDVHGVSSMLRYVAMCCSVLKTHVMRHNACALVTFDGRGVSGVFNMCCVAVCCSVLQCVAVCCSVLHCIAVCCSVWQCIAVYCSVLQCVGRT